MGNISPGKLLVNSLVSSEKILLSRGYLKFHIFHVKLCKYLSFNIFIGTILLPANIVPCFDKYFMSIICTLSAHLLLFIQTGLQKVYIFSETIIMKGYFPHMWNLPVNEIWYFCVLSIGRVKIEPYFKIFVSFLKLTHENQNILPICIHMIYTIMNASDSNNINNVSYYY